MEMPYGAGGGATLEDCPESTCMSLIGLPAVSELVG